MRDTKKVYACWETIEIGDVVSVHKDGTLDVVSDISEIVVTETRYQLGFTTDRETVNYRNFYCKRVTA